MNKYLQRARDAIDDATEDMTAEQLRCHAPGKWCAAEILEHLAITYSGTVKALERCLASGSGDSGKATAWQRLATAVVCGAGYMPKGRKAPAVTLPKGMPPEAVMQAVRNNLRAMDATLEKCEQRFGARRKLAPHLILGPLSVPQWRKFHWVHTRHHMKQVRALRAAAISDKQ